MVGPARRGDDAGRTPRGGLRRCTCPDRRDPRRRRGYCMCRHGRRVRLCVDHWLSPLCSRNRRWLHGKKKNLPSLVRYFCQTTPHTRLRKHDTTHELEPYRRERTRPPLIASKLCQRCPLESSPPRAPAPRVSRAWAVRSRKSAGVCLFPRPRASRVNVDIFRTSPPPEATPTARWTTPTTSSSPSKPQR